MDIRNPFQPDKHSAPGMTPMCAVSVRLFFAAQNRHLLFLCDKKPQPIQTAANVRNYLRIKRLFSFCSILQKSVIIFGAFLQWFHKNQLKYSLWVKRTFAIRFATCSWTQSLRDLSVGAFNSHWHKHPPYPLLSAPRTWSGGMLICVQ